MNISSPCYYDGFKIRVTDQAFIESLFGYSEELILEKTTDPWQNEKWKTQTPNKGISISIFRSKNTSELFAYLSGSFHYLANHNLHNADQFTFDKLEQALIILKARFPIDFSKAELINLEVGCNLEFKFNSISGNELIREVIFLCNKSKTAQKVKWEHIGDGISLIIRRDQYWIKLYCKSCQFHEYSGDKTIIRCEAKYLKADILKENGFYVVSDLLDIEKHSAVAANLKKYFRRLVIFQPQLRCKNDSIQDMNDILRFSTPSTWKNLALREFEKQHKQYLQLVDKYCEENYTRAILHALKERV